MEQDTALEKLLHYEPSAKMLSNLSEFFNVLVKKCAYMHLVFIFLSTVITFLMLCILDFCLFIDFHKESLVLPSSIFCFSCLCL